MGEVYIGFAVLPTTRIVIVRSLQNAMTFGALESHEKVGFNYMSSDFPQHFHLNHTKGTCCGRY